MAIHAQEFEFDNISCKEFGVMIAKIGDSNQDNVSAGSEIDFKKTYACGSKKWIALSEKYSSPISFTIQIIKVEYNKVFYAHEVSAIHRWLKKNGYKKFTFIQDEYEDICVFAKCLTIEEIIIGGKTCGLEIAFETNSALSYSGEIIKEINTQENDEFEIVDLSDEVGSIYPYLDITILENCDFGIKNNLSGNMFLIKNCLNGENITLDQEKGIITTNSSLHKTTIYSDFNYKWMDILNTYEDRINKYKVIGKAKITIKFRYRRKVGV